MSQPTGVKLVKLDWNKECEKDFITGKGFEITEVAFKKKDEKTFKGKPDDSNGKKEKSYNGMHSSRYASD